jgi:ABC-type molybdate transport system permease subunit
MMHTDLEFWSLVVTCAAAVVPWAFSLHSKVAVIASAVEALPEMVAELRDMLEEHETRLDLHEEEIKTLKETARTGH